MREGEHVKDNGADQLAELPEATGLAPGDPNRANDESDAQGAEPDELVGGYADDDNEGAQ